MQQTQKTEKSGYCQKASVEHEGYGRVPSAFHGEMNRQDGENLFERVLERGNLNRAYLQVVRNKGAAGVDGMSYDQLLPYLKENREELLDQLRKGMYQPQPVLRVEIPKPNGGTRNLGIPTVIDRMIQQAIKFYSQYLSQLFQIMASAFVHSAVRKWR